ncbi:MAG: hypothetical protein H6816_07060 [Phycisphaerales bacterium]|nr:hypothetical protein [Phycisphaerales bacterium]
MAAADISMLRRLAARSIRHSAADADTHATPGAVVSPTPSPAIASAGGYWPMVADADKADHQDGRGSCSSSDCLELRGVVEV